MYLTYRKIQLNFVLERFILYFLLESILLAPFQTNYETKAGTGNLILWISSNLILNKFQFWKKKVNIYAKNVYKFEKIFLKFAVLNQSFFALVIYGVIVLFFIIFILDKILWHNFINGQKVARTDFKKRT